MGEIPPAGGRRYLGALPGGPGNPATAQRPDGRSGRFGIRRPRASSRPPHTKTARRLRAGLLLVAERARFELAEELPLRQFSKLVVSATHPPLRGFISEIGGKNTLFFDMAIHH